MKYLALVAVIGSVLLAGAFVAGSRDDVTAQGKLSATISVGSVSALSSGGGVTFDVTRSYPMDRETFWVTNRCFDEAGAVVTRVDYPVIWGTPESLVGYAGSFPTGGTWCEAYVTLRPWQNRALSAVLGYVP
ncbi:MAG TPA: hypothetical protein VIH05_00460 [Tepidiformaceae bacterium]|jgi:hypothetical protein